MPLQHSPGQHGQIQVPRGNEESLTPPPSPLHTEEFTSQQQGEPFYVNSSYSAPDIDMRDKDTIYY